jgi:hypothetical protein
MRKMSLIICLLLVLAAGSVFWVQAQAPDHGENSPVVNRLVVVDVPKIYDDLYLRNLLTSLQNQLASIHAVDQTTLLSHIGVAQGADLRQSSLALSASGPPTPQTQTFALPPGVPAVSYPAANTASSAGYPSGTATTTTPGTQTTYNSVTPTAPTPAAPTLTMPSISSLGQSSLDTYNESLQLSSEINGAALLLNGAISDALQADGKPKTTLTIGFPITVNPPSATDKDLENAIAEVRVTIWSNSTAERPNIVTLLPAERTYNVASLVDKSFVGSLSAVLGGFVNVGGSFLWGHKTYYLVQQQETVALMKPCDTCAPPGYRGTTFAWQIHPVLGKKFLRPGNSVNFVQIAVPQLALTSSITDPIGFAYVSVHWYKGDDKGQFVSAELPNPGGASVSRQGWFPLYYYRLQQVNSVQVTDVGLGNVMVKAVGSFLPGTTIRLGSSFIVPDTITATHDTLTFTTSAATIAAAGQSLILSRDNLPLELINHAIKPKSKLKIDDVEVEPYSDSQALVRIRYTPPPLRPGEDTTPNPAIDPWVVIISGKVFGLSDAPFMSDTGSEIKLLVPISLLQSAARIEMRRLLWPPEDFADSKPVAFENYPKNGPVIAKTVTLSSNSDRLLLGFIGSALDNLQLAYPSPTTCPKCQGTALDSTLFEVSLPKASAKPKAPPPPGKGRRRPARSSSTPAPAASDPTDGLKQIIFCQKSSVPAASKPAGARTPADYCDPKLPRLIVDISKLDNAPAPKFGIDDHDPIALNTPQVTLTGTMLDQVMSIEYAKTPLAFRLSSGSKPSLIVDLPNSISKIPGGYPLLITLADKSTSGYVLSVQKPGS